MLYDLIFRPACRQDASAIARLMIDAAGGMLEFLFAGLLEGVTTKEILATAIAQEQGNLAYQNTLVVENHNRVIAIANSYSATNHRITREIKSFIPPERLALLADFFASRVENSLFLNALSVNSEYRGQGIGTQLVEKVKQKASSQGFSSVSLIVWADNKRAINLYTSLGFEEVKQITIEFHPLLSHLGGAKLMSCLVD